MDVVRLHKKSREIHGTVTIPASKSITNRLLILKALSGGRIVPVNVSATGDSELLQDLLTNITRYQENNRAGSLTLDAGNTGTVMRFLTAYLSTLPGNYMLTGSERMKQRPVGDLVKALKSLGAEIRFLDKNGFPPLFIKGKRFSGGEVQVNATVSSQFISALLLIAPFLKNGLKITMLGEVSSKPYILMTINLMKRSGIEVIWKDDIIIVAEVAELNEKKIYVEADWSAAAFWYEMMALSTSGKLKIMGLKQESVQGDSVLPEIFDKLGVSTAFLPEGILLEKIELVKKSLPEFDFTDHPDLAQPVIICCATMGTGWRFRGLESLRIKETDRIVALQQELQKIGCRLFEETPGIWRLDAKYVKIEAGTIFETYGDHRMAMALAPLAIITNDIVIRNPGVVRKSYPGFWGELQKAGIDMD